MAKYRGTRKAMGAGAKVTVDGKPLAPRNDLVNHSPSGFEWGYGGSGPAQLALAILAHELGDDEALRLYQRFKWDVIAGIKGDEWEITSEDVQRWYKLELEAEAEEAKERARFHKKIQK